METITLRVDEASAKAWNNSSPSLRASYEEKINVILKEMQQPETVDEDGFTKEQLDFLKADAVRYENIKPYEWWNDEELIAELDREEADLESGKMKGFTLEESIARLRDKSLRND